MNISQDTVVSFHYRLSESGKELENSYDAQPALSLIGHENLIPGLENAIIGKTVGDKLSVSVAPQDAYGEYVEREPLRVPIKHLLGSPKKIKVGQIVHVNMREGQRAAVVLKAGKFNVDVDTNHPFAGKTLDFDIEIVDVRAASDDEIAHGHAHGAGGHHH